MKKSVYTTGQIAKLCKVAPRTVSKWFDAGRFGEGAYKIPGSQDRRVPYKNLLKFLRDNKMPQADELEALNQIAVVTVGLEPGLRDMFPLVPDSPLQLIHADTTYEAGFLSAKAASPIKLMVFDTLIGRSQVLEGIGWAKGTEVTKGAFVMVVGDEANSTDVYDGADYTVYRPFDPATVQSQIKLYTGADLAAVA